jgi:hypothetical protein
MVQGSCSSKQELLLVLLIMMLLLLEWLLQGFLYLSSRHSCRLHVSPRRKGPEPSREAIKLCGSPAAVGGEMDDKRER